MEIEKTTGKVIRKDAGDTIRVHTDNENLLEFIHIYDKNIKLGTITIINEALGGKRIKFDRGEE